jgi:outer membrane receptor protein involved in Fe transport
MVRRPLEPSPKFSRWRSGRWTALFAWSLASLSGTAASSAAQAQAFAISIPAASLGEAIRRISDETGASIGFAGPVPPIRTREVRGARSAAEALRRALAGTGFRAVQTGASSFRIEPEPVHERPAARLAQRGPVELSQSEIIVTALKRPQPLQTLAATEHVVRGGQLRSATGLPGTEDLGRDVASLTVSSLGPGRDRLFLRGIGDDPFNGFNQASVAVLLDEARLNYDAPDPDWALVDVDRVEILEGPQGPLYGTGALGGILKVSTNRPDLDLSSAAAFADVSVAADGGLSNSQSLMLNLPIEPGALGLRAVAYRGSHAGWIDNVPGRADVNAERLLGGRLAVRWAAGDRWTIDFSGAVQSRTTRDSQYVDGQLGPLDRPARLGEPRDVDAKLAMVTINGPLGALDLTSVTSTSSQEVVATYDATPLAPTLGTGGPTAVTDDRHYRLFDQEVRVRNPRPGAVDWLAGLSVIQATTDASVTAKAAGGTVPLLALRRSVGEAAAFGEASGALGPRFRLAGGARIFSTSVEDEGSEGASARMLGRHLVRAAADASLSWLPASSTSIFVRAATGYRPGGVNVQPDASQLAYNADQLASIELGLRSRLGRALAIDGTLYASRWQHVQTDELLSNGLIATRNAGNAANVGVEASIEWRPRPRLTLSGGIMAQSARLEPAGQGGAIEDRRLPAVPETSARLRIEQGVRLARWDGRATIGVRYVGSTHLSFDPVLDRRTPAHATIDGSLSLSNGGWTAAVTGENLTNSSADTFSFGNPYRVRSDPQHTPMRPRTVGLSIQRKF